MRHQHEECDGELNESVSNLSVFTLASALDTTPTHTRVLQKIQ